jgi:hypothetical protein
MMASTKFISCKDALCMLMATGRSKGSVIAIILMPLPRLMLPTKGPFFCRCETTIYKVFANIDPKPLLKILNQFGDNLFRYFILEPFLEPAMTGLMR